MEERKQLFKSFENKHILIITQSDFKYHTHNLKVLEDAVVFTDNRNQQIMLSLSEIKLMQEVKNNGI